MLGQPESPEPDPNYQSSDKVTVSQFEPFVLLAYRYTSMSEQLTKQRNEAKLAAAKTKGKKTV